ncbi:carbohydrate ABC transporter permease [Aquisalimonas asiatica]|uniref:sn-glycerol-3-phosphate transport system permease protein UgpE n=1 Tax=Aquisalimonas asiatica TaxID=406100 RepID=A0A1H8RKT7_9GAMM|nr:carbohydrate ABC transporter permease [Aquisalimonas asiatica]SEO66778.1 carbohydrate ABC transporter membrane protein 2, CUT1 family [Aquisalimonas asiatica]
MLTSLFQSDRYQRNLDVALKTLLWTFLLLGVFVTIFPFLWSILLSTHDRSTMFSSELTLYFSDQLINNYQRLMEIMPFWTAMYNSFKVSVLGTLVSLLFCSMCGYALAVYRFRGRNLVFLVMVCSMMIPPVLTLIPYYLVIDSLGLVNTHIAVWLPFTINPIGIFLMRQYTVASVPRELLEAARLDGAGEFRIYWSVVLPLLRPALATLAIVQFVFLWNNFLHPLVVLTESDTQVITLALRSVQNIPNTPWGAVMLGTTISILPLIAIYLVASRQMISGMTSGAVKQ